MRVLRHFIEWRELRVASRHRTLLAIFRYDPATEGREMAETAKGRLGPELVITIGGLVTSVFTASLHHWIAATFAIEVSSFMFWFVIPAGALLVGAAAASGYYLTSIWTNAPATRLVAFNMTIIGFSTYALIQYLNYEALRLPDGRLVSDIVDFWTYYFASIESTSLQFRFRAVAVGRPTGALGELGYIYELLRIAGFLVGGFAVYGHLRNKAYCPDCKRYFVGKEVLLQTSDAGQVDEFARGVWFDVSDLATRFKAVIKEQAVGFDAVVSRCPKCDVKQLEFAAKNANNDRTPFARYLFRGDSPLPASASGAVSTAPTEISPPAEVKCWKCRTVLIVNPENAGKTIPCPSCRTQQRMPS
jgi:hypothetical protein